MLENFVFLVIYDTCDVVYNWSISLLPPIVLDNLFGYPWFWFEIINQNLAKKVFDNDPENYRFFSRNIIKDR